MKREGRQHGVVRTYAILPDPFAQRRHVQTVDSGSVTGLFTKVSRKPTNQSKFTGKCGKSGCNGCHVHPAGKSKDKAKGTMKMRSMGADLDVNDYSADGNMATSDLAFDESYDDLDVYEDDDPTNLKYALGYERTNDDDPAIIDYDLGYETTNDDYGIDYDLGYETTIDHDYTARVALAFNLAIAARNGEYGIGIASVVTNDKYKDKDEDESKSYCDVGLCWGDGEADVTGDDGWYLVGHSQ